MDEVMSDLTTLLNSIDKSGRGVCVQASTLGSLEALLDFLKVSKIPVSGINIGPVHKKDVMRSATMLEKAKELACILCFDVTVDKEAERLAEEMGIRLFKGRLHHCAAILHERWNVLLSKPISSTTCLTLSPRTTTRSWRRRGRTLHHRRFGHVG
jgi:translation initiation factor IF-2